MSASFPASGKTVRKPSSAALPGLSVTPGLNPIVIVCAGCSEKCCSSESMLSPTLLASITGSAKISSTLGAISSSDIDEDIKKPTTERT